MSDDSTKKMNFLNRIITSIKDFDKYQIFALENTRTALKYLLLIMLIFAVLVASIFTYKFNNSINNGINYFKDNINEITYKDSILNINSNEEIKLLNDEEIIQICIINTNATEEQLKQYENEVSKYESGIILLKDKIIYKNAMLSQNLEYNYEYILNQYNVKEFNKEDVTNFILSSNNLNLYATFFITMIIYLFIMYFASAIVDSFMLAILGFIIARIVGMKIKIKSSFNMGIYALTLPIILNLIYIIVNSLTGFTIKYFQWMYTTISYIYMIVAILIIKTDLINRQAELMKIVEEQEKVRKEIEQREQRKKEETNKEPKDENKKEPEEKKKKTKKDKDNDEVGDSGLAPQE